jgi:membrane protease YdiL (CAAX protease family)
VAAQGSGAGWIQSLSDQPFHRYVHRCVLVLALAGLFPLARGLGCRSWSDVGLSFKGQPARRWLSGAGVGWAMFLVVVSLEVGIGTREWKGFGELPELSRRLGEALMAGLLVGVIEETLFRGVLCGGMRRGMGWWPAILLSSAIYSAVHFLERPPAPARVEWWSGLMALSQMLRGIGSVERLVPGFLTLYLAGVLLGVMYWRTGTLFFPMGLHSAWVFCMKLRGWLTRAGEGSGEGRLLTSSWLLCLAVMIVLVAVLWREGLQPAGGGRRSRED